MTARIGHYCSDHKSYFWFESLDNGKCPRCGEYYPDDEGIDFSISEHEFQEADLHNKIIRTMKRQKRYVIK